MIPRAFFTSHERKMRAPVGMPIRLRGLAMGGDTGVARVELSVDGGGWQAAALGPDQGKYGFRLWQATLPAPAAGDHRIALRCINSDGKVQGGPPVWNPGGYMLDTLETLAMTTA